MASFENQAAWQTEAKVRPLNVGPGPIPNPSEDEVVIKVAYAAVNPIDYISQFDPMLEFSYPAIFGSDVAGTIVQLGSNVTRLKLGQRVIGHCDGFLTKKPTNNGFQLYSTCREILVAEVPDSLPLANAAVLPLGFSTAASGLFVNHKLPLPSLAPTRSGKKVLIWGGSSSVGSSAIQLAVAAGFQVLATASPANHEYVKSLGATYAIDHRDAEVVDKVKAIMKPGDVVLDCISTADTQSKCGAIIDSIGGGHLPIVLFPQGNVPESVERSFVNGLAPSLTNPEVGDGTWRKFLGQALAAGKFQAKPDPHVITGGLPKVQEGLDFLKKGVSATKVVIEISKE